MDFQDKIIWITGASSGIGEGLVVALARQNAKLILSARRAEELERVKNICVTNGADPARIRLLPLDVSELDTLPAAAVQAHALFGGLDILVNNAGVGMRGFVADTEMAVQQRVMQVNYFGTIALTKSVLTYMQQARRGHIVVISSLSGKLAVPGRSAYCASKHALHGFFDALRGEVYADNIKVTLICPGFVRTHISENALRADGTRRGGKTDKEHRGGMSPADSAKHILYAIRTGKEEYDYGGKERFVVPIRRLFPWLYSRAIRKVRLSS